MSYLGHRARIASRLSKGSFFLLLSFLGLLAGVPFNIAYAASNAQQAPIAPSNPAFNSTSGLLRGVGANELPDLSLPKTVLSSVDNLLSTSGTIQSSSDNVTLYNSAISLRLLGGKNSHDELLGRGREVLSSWSFWTVQYLAGASWVSLNPVSSNFTLLGTNATGTFIVRTMRVAAANVSGTFTIEYRATSAGPLKWNLHFQPSESARYRMSYLWENLTGTSVLSLSSESLREYYRAANYTLLWNDVPSYLTTNTTMSNGDFSLFVNLGVVNAGSLFSVDPSIVATNVGYSATALGFQRHVFYEPTGGYYFVFYSNGSYSGGTTSINYRSSRDGVVWSSPQYMPTGWPSWTDTEASSAAVLNLGTQVIVATGTSKSAGSQVFQFWSSSAYYIQGTINGPAISWGPVNTLDTLSIGFSCGSSSSCVTMGVRDINIGVNSNENVAFSYNEFYTNSLTTTCNSTLVVASGALPNPHWKKVDQRLSCDTIFQLGDLDLLRSIVLPADPLGGFRIIYQYPSSYSGVVSLFSKTVDVQGNLGNRQTVDTYGPSNDQFSAVSDSSYGDHLVYTGKPRGPSGSLGNITYGYCGSGCSSWGSYSTDLLSGNGLNPTVTIDLSTGFIYIFGYELGSIAMRSKAPGRTWFDGSLIFPVDNQPTLRYLGSTLASVSTNFNHIPLVWTVASGSQYNAMFASVPIETVWSPYSTPTDPWNGNGIAPYGQYFANLGEYVSPFNGALTVTQTDLSTPGRGLDLSLTRVYTEPSSFLSGNPYNFEGPYGFHDTTFLNGWTADPGVTAITDGDILSLSGTTTTTGYTQIFGPGGPTTNAFPYLVVKAKGAGTLVVQTGHSDGSTGDSITMSLGTNYGLYAIILTPGKVTSSISFRNQSVPGTNYIDYVEITRPSIIGNGWQFNYPWMSNTANPQFIHLWNGEGYRIPQNFWSGSSATIENHQGEHFVLVRNSTGIFLSTSTGLFYRFEPTANDLTRIQDQLGNNIAFSYDSTNRISSITDTVGRVFQFRYNASLPMLVQSINQTSTGVSVRGIVFKYDDKFSLISVTDPAGRITRYSYNSYGDPSARPWLLTRVTYPTTWYDNYTYTAAALGSAATTYRVSWQSVNATIGTPIRHFGYSYTTGPGDAIANSTIADYDGVSQTPVGYTTYSFSYAGVTWNISDASHHFVRGQQQIFGIHGEVPREIVLVSPTQGYTNYFRYDLWGNLIYSSRVINPSANWYHQSFNAYYNDGLPPGFRAFQETFSQNQGNATDNPWFSNAGNWNVKNGVYNGTYVNGNLNNTFSWANFSSTDVSIKARVYLARQINSTATAGIFVHYPSSGTEKWSLYLVTGVGVTGTEIVDDGVAGSTVVTCSLSSVVGSWYTFNLTSYGSSLTGWVQQDGQPACPSVNYSFPNSPVSRGAGFGLSAGGFSALFDNFTATTVSPLITTTGFSNSFFPRGPSLTVHGTLAGTAELQNVTTTAPPVPIETYNSYYSWGGLNQTKQLYNSPQGTQWVSSARKYDAYGNPFQFTDSRGNTTTYGYSSRYQYAYLTSQTQTLIPGNVQITNSFSYNFTTGAQLSRVDANGFNTTSKYDILGRTTRITYPTGDYASYAYNDIANYVDITNENGWHTRNIYDGLGRLTVIERFSASRPYSNESYQYNWMDKVTVQTDALQHSYTYQYDLLGRPLRTTEPNGNYTRIAYQDVSAIVSFYDETGHSSFEYYDRIGRPIRIVQWIPGGSSNIITIYYYDEVGNLRQIIRWYSNVNLQITVYNYDNLNRLTKTNYPDQTSESYFYDNNGNIAQKTDRTGSSATMSYDSLNRPYLIQFNPTLSDFDSYTYDNNGNLLLLYNQNATTTYSYDSRNRVRSEEYTFIVSSVNEDLFVNYTYSGETLSRIFYPDRSQFINFTYDALGRVTGVFTPGNSWNYATLYYYPTNQVKSVTYRNNLYANYTYDSMSRPSMTTLTKPGTPATTLLSLSYNYTKTGTVGSVSGQVNGLTDNEQYTYDSLQRLTNATLTKGSTQTTLSYQYDSMGNRVWQKQNGAVTTYSYNSANNQLISSNSGSTSTSYSYDRNGNLLAKNVTAGGTSHWVYKWDAAGDLDQVSNDNGVQGTYVYDGNGRLVGSVEGAAISAYTYQGTETLSQSIFGSSSTDYIFAGGMRIAKIANGSTVTYYHADTEGSTRLVTSSTGSVLFADNYLPFGEDNGTPTGSETYKFTGKPLSATTGLYYEYQRWYDPTIGRFISQDPLAGHLSDPQSLNPYIYATDQPTGITDPSGMDGCGIFSSVCSFVSSGVTTAWNGLTTVGSDISNGWNSLSPDEQQGLILAGFVALTFATGGTDLLVIGGIGAAAAVGGYLGGTYAAGGTPTLAGALMWANVGFGVTTGIDSLAELGAGGGLNVAERLAANRAAGLGYEGQIADTLGLARNIGVGRTVLQGTKTAGSAVPDFVTDTFIGEAKFTQSTVYSTRQIRIEIEGAAQAGKAFNIFVPEGTRVADSVFEYGVEFGVKVLKIPFP